MKPLEIVESLLGEDGRVDFASCIAMAHRAEDCASRVAASLQSFEESIGSLHGAQDIASEEWLLACEKLMKDVTRLLEKAEMQVVSAEKGAEMLAKQLQAKSPAAPTEP